MTDRQFIATYTLVIIASIFIVPTVIRAYDLITDPNYYGWPAVTKCPLCEKTVWSWQSYERRPFQVNVTGDTREIPAVFAASGLVHKSCKGTPVQEITVSFK